MEILKLASVGVITSLLCLYLGSENKMYALYVALVGGLIILMMSISYINPIFEVISTFSQRTIYGQVELKPILKIISTAYIAQFASDTCKDASQNSLASKIELGARFLIVYFSLPIVVTLFEYITSLLG